MTEVGGLSPVYIAAAAAIILVLLLIWFVLRRRGGSASPRRERREPGLAARIDLTPHTGDWHRPEAAGLAGQLRALGFEEVGRFAVPQMAPMRLWAGTQGETGFAAVVYDHPDLPPFFDLVRAYLDGSSCTVTNSALHDPANLPPGNVCVADPRITPEDAFDTLLAQPLDGTPLKVDAGNFVAVFTAQYARSMDYILSRPPPDAAKMQEVGAKMAELTGTPMPALDEGLMRHAVDLERQSRLAGLEQAIGARLVESGEVEAGAWRALQPSALCIHDLLTPEEAAALIVRGSADPGMARPAADAALAMGLPPIDTAETLLAALPEAVRPRLVGEVDHPLYAQVYAPPA